MNSIKNAIIADKLNTISIYCHKGRHRSVATAELLKKDLSANNEYIVHLHHLDIK